MALVALVAAGFVALTIGVVAVVRLRVPDVTTDTGIAKVRGDGRALLVLGIALVGVGAVIGSTMGVTSGVPWLGVGIAIAVVGGDQLRRISNSASRDS